MCPREHGVYILVKDMKVKRHSQIQTVWYERKGIIIRNGHVKYKNPTSNCSKKVFVTDILKNEISCPLRNRWAIKVFV